MTNICEAAPMWIGFSEDDAKMAGDIALRTTRSHHEIYENSRARFRC